MQPVRMQRRGKHNTTSKGRAVASDSKENRNINKGRQPAEEKTDAGVKKSKAVRKHNQAAPRSKPASSDPVASCVDVSNTTQEQNAVREKDRHAEKRLLEPHMHVEDMQECQRAVAEPQSSVSAQEDLHGTAAASLNMTAAGGPGNLFYDLDAMSIWDLLI